MHARDNLACFGATPHSRNEVKVPLRYKSWGKHFENTGTSSGHLLYRADSLHSPLKLPLKLTLPSKDHCCMILALLESLVQTKPASQKYKKRTGKAKGSTAQVRKIFVVFSLVFHTVTQLDGQN